MNILWQILSCFAKSVMITLEESAPNAKQLITVAGSANVRIGSNTRRFVVTFPRTNGISCAINVHGMFSSC